MPGFLIANSCRALEGPGYLRKLPSLPRRPPESLLERRHTHGGAERRSPASGVKFGGQINGEAVRRCNRTRLTQPSDERQSSTTWSPRGRASASPARAARPLASPAECPQGASEHGDTMLPPRPQWKPRWGTRVLGHDGGGWRGPHVFADVTGQITGRSQLENTGDGLSFSVPTHVRPPPPGTVAETQDFRVGPWPEAECLSLRWAGSSRVPGDVTHVPAIVGPAGITAPARPRPSAS